MTHDSSIQEGHETSAGTPRFVIIRNGPCLLDGSIPVVDPLGVPVAANAPVRLCCCGQSQTKPFCDNSHIERSFTDDKNPQRVTDKLDVHEGQQAYVFDNRGTCAHSGFCTDRLSSVFHLRKEPFVSPSGARLDDLVNAVRKCPRTFLIQNARRRSKSPGTALIASRETSGWSTKTACSFHKTKVLPGSTSACAGAGRPSTSPSAAECTGASNFRIQYPIHCVSQRCSSGSEDIPRFST